MSTLGFYRLPSGRTIEVEIAGPPPTEHGEVGEFAPAGPGRGAQKVIQTTLDLKSSLEAVGELSDTLLDGLLSSARRPEEITVELAFKVGATGNLIIVGGSEEGSVKVGLKYNMGAVRWHG